MVQATKKNSPVKPKEKVESASDFIWCSTDPSALMLSDNVPRYDIWTICNDGSLCCVVVGSEAACVLDILTDTQGDSEVRCAFATPYVDDNEADSDEFVKAFIQLGDYLRSSKVRQ
jgi:hypothetical protein